MKTALDIIAGITGSQHPDTAQVVVTIGLLRRIERQAKGGPVAHAILTPVDQAHAGAAA
ncbi:hypothetical protein [Sphingomonas olei]|uniref:hypothetical protein n=1 Tax=Sphingomonas olei TaxID=1886787 RepID=UPI00145565B9|nr:hypothetical protein [Sphingomonas olei]